MKKIFTLFVLSLLATLAFGKGGYQRVYMFGIATTFSDSTVVITDVQAVDSAFLGKKGELADRNMFSLQLNVFMDKIMARPNSTCAVYYNTNRKKLEKQYIKLRSRFLTDNTTRLVEVTEPQFEFDQVEHITK